MSEPGKPHSEEFGWTLPQRRAMVCLQSVFLLALIVFLAINRRFVPEHPTRGPRAGELASRLDPNIADWHALAAIPNLGEKRAKDIIAFRQRMQAEKPGVAAFKVIYDLRLIRGIGPATIERLRPYLIFPGEDPTSLPVPNDEGEPTQ